MSAARLELAPASNASCEMPMSQSLRHALGDFVTGVTIVSARVDGERFGVTANSFNSVSLDPPLVLVSLARKLRSFQAFMRATRFSVSLLAHDQADLARRFATAEADKWAKIPDPPERVSSGAPPAIPGAMACFECEPHARYDGGDHMILVGRVVAFERSARDPLVYHRGQFKSLAATAAEQRLHVA